MRLLVLFSVLILSGLNSLGRDTPRPYASASVNQSPESATQTQATRSAIAKRLSRVCGQWAEHWRLKQLDKIVAMYAPDAVFLTGTGDRISGRAAIRSVFKTAMASHTSDLTPRSLVTEVSGNLAYDSGDYMETITTASGAAKTELKGNYVIVFKRQSNGKWLIVEHVWTDRPAA